VADTIEFQTTNLSFTLMKRSRTIRYALETFGEVFMKDEEEPKCFSLQLSSQRELWRKDVTISIHLGDEVSLTSYFICVLSYVYLL